MPNDWYQTTAEWLFKVKRGCCLSPGGGRPFRVYEDDTVESINARLLNSVLGEQSERISTVRICSDPDVDAELKYSLAALHG